MSYMKSSQNCDNFISDRSSTRLHAPPGGKSSMGSLLFGGDAPAAAPRTTKMTETPVTAKAEVPLVESKILNVPAPVESAPSKISSNKYANGANQNSGNFITDRPTTRVHAAPGGQSSMGGLLNWGH